MGHLEQPMVNAEYGIIEDMSLRQLRLFEDLQIYLAVAKRSRSSGFVLT
jgi:predicted phosphatase